MSDNSKEAPINYVIGVSYPRSGHHLMERLLGRYIGPRFVYCPLYTKNKLEAEGFPDEMKIKDWNYNCCINQTCPNYGQVHFCKNHEWDGEVLKTPGKRYLIQYREFLPAVVSHFELERVNSVNNNTEEGFRRYSLKRAEEYVRFMNHWISPKDDGVEKLVIKYEDLTSNPKEWMVKTLEFFGFTGNIDTARLEKALSLVPKITVLNNEKVDLKHHGIENSRKVEEFRFYSPEWFAELDKMTRHAA